MPRKVHLTPTTSAIPDLLARQIDADVVGVEGAKSYEVEVLLLDFVIEHLTGKRAALRESSTTSEQARRRAEARLGKTCRKRRTDRASSRSSSAKQTDPISPPI